MTISSTIKELRKNKKITQEDLAEKLNVSVQTISRWENATSMPDITILPTIADIFEVSIDFLLGYGKILNDKQWVEMYGKISSYIQESKNIECLEYLTKMLNLYPDDTRVQLWYASICRMVPKDKHLLADAINIYEKLIRVSTDEKIRVSAETGLFYTYMKLDDKVKMREVYETYLKSKVGKDYYKMYFLEGDERIEYLQYEIDRSLAEIFNAIRQLRKGNYYTKEEKNVILEKYINILEIMYEKEDFGFNAWKMYDICKEICIRYNELGNSEKCLEFIQKATKYSIQFDTLEHNFKHKSILFNMLEWSKEQMSMNGYIGNMSDELINILKSDEFIKYSNEIIYVNSVNTLSRVAQKF